MKKVFTLVLIAGVFISASASAQKVAKGKMGGVAKEYLMDSLGLSETNADSVVAITQSSMIQIKSIMKDQSLSQDQKKEKLQPIKEDMKMRLEKYMTKDQMRKMKEIEMEKRQEKMNNK